jgi:hypothetical protein
LRIISLFYFLLQQITASMNPNSPPYPAYRASEKGSFAGDRTVRRWPIIIDSAVSDMRQAVNSIPDDNDMTRAKKEEGKAITTSLNQLKQEIADDKVLR